jgi:hypothetical protein
MKETIQERVRNMVGSFYNMKTLFKNIATEEDYEKRMKFVNYILDNSEQIYHTMDNSINYLIDMSKIIDENLPDGFDINELLDKEKYQS